MAEHARTGEVSFLVFRERVVGITVKPALAWLGGSDNRMTAGAGVFGGVAVWGIVATERCAALLTNPQMHPGRADLHTFLTLSAGSQFDCRDLGKVEAGTVRHS
jgi:hypothetical protein